MEYRLGVVLSGGGTRGIAHAGVLQALREEGIDVDCLSGTSSGALVGALYAAGHSTEAILEFFHTESPFRIGNIALGKPGFIDTDKVQRSFLAYFPEDRFEALERRLFVAATDLVRGRLEIFASGPLIRPVLASSSIPLVFTPTRIGDRYFADGGILDNFPVDPLLGLCDVILGVHASPLRDIRQEELRSSLDVSHRALEIGMTHGSKSKFHHCDLVISPPQLADFGAYGTRHIEEMREIGYRAACENMAEIRELLEVTKG